MNYWRAYLPLLFCLILCSCENPIQILLPTGDQESYEVPSDKYVSAMGKLLDRTHQDTMVAIKKYEENSAKEDPSDEPSFKLNAVRMGVTAAASGGVGDYYNLNGDIGLELVIRKIK